jgi:pimeloyl-ACP methyl ester carboxylesterase
VVHDWGAFIGYKYENRFPEKVKRMIAIDVGFLKF